MDVLNYLKNPIVLGILASVLTYLYLYWEAEQKHKKNPKIEKKTINFITPAVIGVIIWFISSSFIDRSSKDEMTIAQKGGDHGIYKNKITNLVDSNVNTQVSKNSFGIHTKSSDNLLDSQSFYLIGKNKIDLPNTDVFIDIAKF